MQDHPSPQTHLSSHMPSIPFQPSISPALRKLSTGNARCVPTGEKEGISWSPVFLLQSSRLLTGGRWLDHKSRSQAFPCLDYGMQVRPELAHAPHSCANAHCNATITVVAQRYVLTSFFSQTHPHPRQVGWMEATSPGLAGLAQQIDLPWNAERHKIRGRLAGGKIRLKQGDSCAAGNWCAIAVTHTVCYSLLPLQDICAETNRTGTSACVCVACFPLPAWLAVCLTHCRTSPIFDNSSAPDAPERER
jgi:hypothetical protein